MSALEQLRALARGKVHGGYRWAMVAGDGEIICETCVRENYRQIYRATSPRSREWANTGWQCVGITHSGECEGEYSECCANCNVVIFEGVQS